MSDAVLSKVADNIRILAAAMVEKAKSGHPGGAMGGAEFVSVLFSEFLSFDPDDPFWPERDRFFLDPGHMSPMLYAILHLCGKYSREEIQQFRQWGSPTPGHPELDVKRGIENTSGPLGQGHAMALGTAIAERFMVARFGEVVGHKTFAYISDGGIQEEIAQGVGRLAGHLGLHNLIVFYDSNGIQLSTPTSVVTSEDTAKKYEAWGWVVTTIDGNNIVSIRKALQQAVAEKERPTLIIGKTVMGKGAVTADGTSAENRVSLHGQPLSKAGASFEKTVLHLGGDRSDPFAVFPEVKEYFAACLEKKAQIARQRKEAFKIWESENPQLAARLRSFRSGNIPPIDYSSIRHASGIATRTASGNVLATYAVTVPNMLVSSADLCDSDNTNAFLKHTKPLAKGDFSGAFLQAGVSELTMAAVMNGVALHGGIIPVCGTFLVFSDYMKPAVRLAALMGLPVKYVWTHDSFRVGEDGPTHQPVEHEAQLRLLEKMNNLEGHRSFLVLRPADAAETTIAWKIALENQTCPTALLLSRQNVVDIPACKEGTRFLETKAMERGAYIVREAATETPDVILVGNGSEVATLLEVAQILSSQKNLSVRVVSAPCEALFREQTAAYQDQILPPWVPTFGLTAGVAATLESLLGPLGMAAGMNRFGASAPYTVLDEKFGFTPAVVARQVEAYLAEFPRRLERLRASEKTR